MPLLSRMEDEIAYLRSELDQEREARTEERRRHDTLMATFLQRLPELEAPREEPHGPETVAETTTGTETPSGETGVQGRSWWRRFFGFD